MNSCNDPLNTDGLLDIPGRLVGWASTKGISPGRRWRELFFYETSNGRLVCHRVERSEDDTERERHAVFELPAEARKRALLAGRGGRSGTCNLAGRDLHTGSSAAAE